MDVARYVGVSRPLVSIVLRGVEGASETTRQRVLQAASELGYRPDSLARGLRSQRTRHLGVVFSLRRPFEVELIEHMYPVAAHRRYHLLLGATTTERDQDQAVDELLSYRCEGLVVVGPEVPGQHLEAVAHKVPLVEVGRALTHAESDIVRNDDASGARQAVDHLVGLGHSRVALIDGGANPGAEDRRRGYCEAMAFHRLGAEIRVVAGGYTEEDGSAAARALLDKALPTAVIASNDLSAIGLLDTMIRAGVRVPADLSVVGYDDSRFARLPGIDLTSVRQDIPRMAKLAVEGLAERLDVAPHPRREISLPPLLVVRGTTSPPERSHSRAHTSERTNIPLAAPAAGGYTPRLARASSSSPDHATAQNTFAALHHWTAGGKTTNSPLGKTTNSPLRNREKRGFL